MYEGGSLLQIKTALTDVRFWSDIKVINQIKIQWWLLPDDDSNSWLVIDDGELCFHLLSFHCCLKVICTLYSIWWKSKLHIYHIPFDTSFWGVSLKKAPVSIGTRSRKKVIIIIQFSCQVKYYQLAIFLVWQFFLLNIVFGVFKTISNSAG